MLDNRLKTISYITDMSREMHRMAIHTQSPLLALLLEMAANEGQNILDNSSANQPNG